jgi:hypothetical protein
LWPQFCTKGWLGQQECSLTKAVQSGFDGTTLPAKGCNVKTDGDHSLKG